MINTLSNEDSHYNYTTNTCKGYCANYKQIVWAETNEVGCAKMLCPYKPSNPIGSSGKQQENQGLASQEDQIQATQMACFYRPAGNVETDRPYKDKDAASKMMSSVGMLISVMLVLHSFK
uniref:SCP domain-containing protein n=1 Tax=Mesocestoides corti TaxID=53468 RepID=A0A5K3EYT3_MESCO